MFDRTNWIRPVFIVAGIYDAVLGIAFLVGAGRIFSAFGVTPPNHLAYVEFPALLLLVFAAMFFRIARDPAKFRDLIPYGMGLKLSYSALAFWYQSTSDIATMWIPWAWIDLVFFILFLIAWRVTSEIRGT
jgi:hypothetical protein